MPAAVIPADAVRGYFSAALSRLYRREVPAYGTLLKIVGAVNRQCLDSRPALKEELLQNDNLSRLDEERHGAIRLGSAEELNTMRRMFALMGMFAVGYYDLSVAGIPVHSTAFRPVSHAALAQNPFRVFTSLLRLELIDRPALRREAAAIVNRRRIFTPEALALLEQAEKQGGLSDAQARDFVAALVETFRWHKEALVSGAVYRQLHDQHALIADIVSFKGPHINHLTPRTLDIDEVQQQMPHHGIRPKAFIEGPPPRRCPVLLRQTSFRALEEDILFSDRVAGVHTARFGEIEQRGAALTAAGHALYDKLLLQARQESPPAGGNSDPPAYRSALKKAFAAFPDDWDTLFNKKLAYFRFIPLATAAAGKKSGANSIATLLDAGAVGYAPITYEDFLPVSAAGIFQSNLRDDNAPLAHHRSDRRQFEKALGQPLISAFALYEKIQAESLAACLEKFSS